jgi:ribosome biogenesis GTPase / thiamine phosphate phosphatase
MNPDSGSTRGRVLSGTGGVWRVHTAQGSVVNASMRGRLKKADYGRREGGAIRRDTVEASAQVVKLAVGDHVMVTPDAVDDAWTIDEILPRSSRLARRAPGGGYGERIIAANVDQVVVVFAAAKPEPHPRMLDRFLVIAEANQIPARVIVNKVELTGEDAARGRFHSYEEAGYPLHYTSVLEGRGLEPLQDVLRGRTSVLTGPSGVGKSSLMNALFPGLNLRVAEISESVNKGRHTTVGAFAHPLPGDEGGYVVDTPGLREVGLWNLGITRLDHCFPEFRPLTDQCRFADCRHSVEPGCGIRTALAEGRIEADRYESYLKLMEELAG